MKKESLDKINNNLMKQMAEHIAEIKKQNIEDNRIKYRLVWKKYDDVLWKHLKMTDIFCMQVADNKILRRENEYLKNELRNYAPEHHFFNNDSGNNGGSSEDSSTSNPSTDTEDGSGLSSFRRGDETIN